jgi:transposase
MVSELYQGCTPRIHDTLRKNKSQIDQSSATLISQYMLYWTVMLLNKICSPISYGIPEKQHKSEQSKYELPYI